MGIIRAHEPCVFGTEPIIMGEKLNHWTYIGKCTFFKVHLDKKRDFKQFVFLIEMATSSKVALSKMGFSICRAVLFT